MAKVVDANEEFLKEVDLVLQDNTRVKGELKEKGSTVTLGGNDKMQLLASKKAVVKEAKK